MKKSIYHWMKEFKKQNYWRPIDIIKGKRFSLWNKKYENRVFYKNMIEGLCDGKLYGRQKIIYKRKGY